MEHRKFFSKMGKKGGKSRWDNFTPEQRETHIKKMVEGKKLKVESLSKDNNIEIKHG